ncbi:hypothetical protein DKX38_008871 [Salix brachista]|uniref:Glycosyltransferase n=1 Tax=Salix brachista TaxID=2182728 RepID=A0A5N5M972_9ROSI|nr:hypothetical protein DKX38_008871 [Salix brachista]
MVGFPGAALFIIGLSVCPPLWWRHPCPTTHNLISSTLPASSTTTTTQMFSDARYQRVPPSDTTFKKSRAISHHIAAVLRSWIIGPDDMNGLPDFRFESIPDGLPPSNENATQDVAALCEAAMKNLLAPFNSLLDKLNDSASSNAPPVTCIVSDGFIPVAIDAAEMHQIPIALFFTISACSFMGFKQFQALQEKGLTPLKDESFLTNGYLDKVVDWIPGMRDIRLRDLPSFIRTTDPDDILFKFCAVCAGRASEGSAVIFHTFDVLEQEVLNALYPMFPRVYTIGPLELLLNQKQEADLSSVGCNLWKEEVECLHWLDSNKPRSVIYVNFGSITTVTKEQLVEFGMGLAESGHPFLWIIRPDMVAGDSAILPPEYTEETKERSFICSWCPQEEVLNHPSIGGFLTHSGWGSTIESISSGVPMLCWPFCGDQQTNCRYTCLEWGIGMEIDSNVKRENVKKLVIELMEGEKGEKMKKKAMEWRKLAEEASGASGSSYRCCFETFSDGIPYSDIDATQETDSNIAAAQNNMLALFIEVNAMGLQFAAEERSKVLVFFKKPVLN